MNKQVKETQAKLNELTDEFQGRIAAGNQYDAKYKSIKKIMKGYKDDSESQPDEHYSYFSMYRQILERKMMNLSKCSEMDISGNVRDVIEFLLSMASRGINKRGLWKLCKQAYESIDEAPAVFVEGSAEKLSQMARQLILDREEADHALERLDSLRQLIVLVDEDQLPVFIESIRNYRKAVEQN
jgi:hypothetical protein